MKFRRVFSTIYIYMCVCVCVLSYVYINYPKFPLHTLSTIQCHF